jgi:PIN domain nuclease of toxin-antitoxin system
LLDTHVVLWIADGGQRLNPKTHAILANPLNERLVSHVSLWEMAIKRSAGKLTATEQDIDRALGEMAVIELSIARHHVQAVGTLPFHHRDPFDRLLIAQAKTEKLTLISSDRHFAAYEIKLLPA